MNRYFGWTFTDNWRETNGEYMEAKNHAEVAAKMALPCKRVTNERYREIETTGRYYRITETGKGGKAFIFEVID